jgi:hypothetical protein
MRRVAWREPACRAEGAPYRHLAVRVIAQAFRDLAIPTGSAAGQESAREFLAGNSMLYHWCEVADLNPVSLVARARRLMAASAESQPRPWIVEGNPVCQRVTRKEQSREACATPPRAPAGNDPRHESVVGRDLHTRRDGRLSRGNGRIPRRTEQKGMGEKRSGMDSLNAHRFR